MPRDLVIPYLFSNCPAPLLSLTDSSEQLGLCRERDAPSLLLCQRAGCSLSDVGVGADLDVSSESCIKLCTSLPQLFLARELQLRTLFSRGVPPHKLCL
jgi:hypothetical protein